MDPVIAWLLEGDPSIRWQVHRDLLEAPEDRYLAERQEVGGGEWASQLFLHQGADGRWSRNTYTPKWTSTFYTMQMLWQLGVDPSDERCLAGARVLLDEGLCEDGGLLYPPASRKKRPRFGETCVSGMGLAASAWFLPQDARLETVVAYLLGDQTPDGGWNCRYRPRGDAHGSFNTTILALEGLLEWERQRGFDPAVDAARQRCHEFLLRHRMFRSHTTGEVVSRQYTMLSFPGRWHYDILRGLDYLAASGAIRDPRAAEAIDVIRGKQRHDGTWPVQHRHAGEAYFEMEQPGRPSRWNTLRALRVLRWWDSPE